MSYSWDGWLGVAIKCNFTVRAAKQYSDVQGLFVLSNYVPSINETNSVNVFFKMTEELNYNQLIIP